MSSKKNTRKVMISLGVVGAAAAVAGMGTFGTFTSTTSGSQAVSSGTVKIALGDGAGGAISAPVSNIVAGDIIQRTVTLANTGNTALGGVSLATSAAPTSKLDTDATNGLQLSIDACSVAWAQTGTGPATCNGTTSIVLAAKPVIGAANTPVTLPTALAPNKTDNLRVTLALPIGADNSFQTLSSTIKFDFTGTQRVGSNQ